MIIVMLLLHYVIGIFYLYLIGFRKKNLELLGLSFPIGIGIGTVTIFIMEMFGIRLTHLSVSLAFVIVALVLLVPVFKYLKTIRLNIQLSSLKNISLPEWIFILVIFLLFFISFWRCYYLPITPYDSIQGIDLLAKYAVEDGHINSRIFSDLKYQMSTQSYYAPFTALSQIIYRFSGHPFGKIWLSFMFLSIILIVYINLRQKIHPILAGFLTILLISVPEMYAYTFLVQTDYSNAIYVSISVLYAYYFIKEKKTSYFWISSLLFGFGVWSRSETIVFSVLMTILIFIFTYTDNSLNSYKYSFIFLGISFFFFAVWNLYYLPIVLDYSPESYFKFGFWDWERLKTLIHGMVNILMITSYWGYIFHFFSFVFIVNLFIFHDKDNIFFVLWISLVFTGFILILYHLQFNIEGNINKTFRRGVFKFIPVIIFYIGTSRFFSKISNLITNFENHYLPGINITK